MPIVDCPKCRKRYDPGLADDMLDDEASADLSFKVVCPACGQWLRLPERQMIPAPAFAPELLEEMMSQSRLVDAPTSPAPATSSTDDVVIPVAMAKVIFCWIFSVPILLAGILFVIFRWSLFGVPWFITGPGAIFVSIVLIWVWDGLLPLRKTRIVIGSDSFQIVEFGSRVVTYIPFRNIQDVRVEDYFDKSSGNRMKNYYVFITLRDGQDDQTRGSFLTDEASGMSCLQLQDSYAFSTRKICETLQSRLQAFNQRR